MSDLEERLRTASEIKLDHRARCVGRFVAQVIFESSNIEERLALELIGEKLRGRYAFLSERAKILLTKAIDTWISSGRRSHLWSMGELEYHMCAYVRVVITMYPVQTCN